jgi:hypothetical protein
MNKILPSTLLTLLLAAGTAAAAADGSQPKSAAAVASALAGEFAGEWRAENDVNGALKLTFKQGKDAVWTLEASFTFEGANVPTKTKTLRVEGGKIETVFAWEIQGTAASSKLIGELKGDRLEGTYESTTTEGAAKGKWHVTRVPAGS